MTVDGRRNPKLWETFARLVGGKVVVTVVLGALVGGALTYSGVTARIGVLPPLAAGFVAALPRPSGDALVASGAVAAALGYVPAALASPGHPLLGVYGPVTVDPPLAALALGIVYATCLGAIGAYTATIFHTQGGREAWYRHVMRWRWWP